MTIEAEFTTTYSGADMLRLLRNLCANAKEVPEFSIEDGDVLHLVMTIPKFTRVENEDTIKEIFFYGRNITRVSWEQTKVKLDFEIIRFKFIQETPNVIRVRGYCLEPIYEQAFRRMLRTIGGESNQDANLEIMLHDVDMNGPAKSKRGMKIGTAERITEMHRLLKLGQSQRQAKKNAGCDPSTYYRHCKEVTAEDPILPYR